MKSIYKISGIALLFLIFACTDNFEDINTNDTTIPKNQLEATDFFAGMFNNIYQNQPAWSTQLQQNLNGDVYSGYMMPPTGFASNINNMTYALVDGWNNFPWNVAYSNIMLNAFTIEGISKETNPKLYALSLILKVEAMHRVTDIYGPIVYSRFGENPLVGYYDSQETVYNTFFEELDYAITTLSDSSLPDVPGTFAATDQAYGGDIDKWVQFANSLRLRLAIRISKVNPSKAQTEGEKSLAHSGGLIDNNTNNFLVDGKVEHPLATIAASWNDIRMGASMESILTGYEDPRLEKYFEESEVSPGEYKGIRIGINADKPKYQPFSNIGESIIRTTLIQLMTASEVHFLKAEAALRGWAGAGDAQANYEAGIATSFDQHGVADASYASDNTKVAADYTDPVEAAHNTGAVSNITIAWDAAASNEVKLEKIITQKWIAMFPDGQEAWSEFRRTGYPKLFPVVNNKSNGEIDTDIQIRRLKFADSDKVANSAEVEKAVSLLGGPDTGGTRLWWDIAGGNF